MGKGRDDPKDEYGILLSPVWLLGDELGARLDPALTRNALIAAGADGAARLADSLHRRHAKRRAEPGDPAVARRWAGPLGGLRALLDYLPEVRDRWVGSDQDASHPATRNLRRTLREHHERGALVGLEIAVLLEFGLPEGARARWRTLHEITATARMIRRGGDPLAYRYLCHEVVTSVNDMERRRDHFLSMRLDPSPLGVDAEYEEGKALRQRLVDQFEPEFKNDYGWAAAATKSKKPRFEDVEKAADMSDWRPSYADYSGPVHASTRSLADVSRITNGGGHLTRPTKVALGIVGIMALRSLMYLTTSVLAVDETDRRVIIRAMETAAGLDRFARGLMQEFAAVEPIFLWERR